MRIEKIMTILNYLSREVGKLDKLKAVKLLYYIDKTHLINYGRFVTNDTYFKWAYGPVPIRILNIIDEIENLSENEKKYVNKYINVDLRSKHRTITSKMEPDLLELSKSELRIINQVIKKYGKYSGPQLIDITHKEYAYIQAANLGIISKRSLINDLPEDRKKELLEYLESEQGENELISDLCS